RCFRGVLPCGVLAGAILPGAGLPGRGSGDDLLVAARGERVLDLAVQEQRVHPLLEAVALVPVVPRRGEVEVAALRVERRAAVLVRIRADLHRFARVDAADPDRA